MLTGLAFAGPNGGVPSGVTAKASNGTLTNINLVTDPCAGVSGSLTVTATGTTDDGGGNDLVWFTIYDDSVEKFAVQLSIPVGTTRAQVVNVNYPGVVGGSAPGIGLFLGESRGSSGLVSIDPFFPTASGTSCASSAPVATPTLSEWSLATMAAILAFLGFGVMRRRRR